MSVRTFAVWCILALAAATVPLGASARPLDAVQTFSYTQNMHPIGYSPRIVPTENASPIDGIFNSDIAFWGDIAYHGNYEGFRIIDISAPGNPKEINDYAECSPASTAGNQGDVIIWEDILIRSWNSPAPSTFTATCDGEPVPAGWEGLHVFDVSNPLDPDLVASVETPSGSHTATLVPDLANDRLLVYNNSAPGGFDMVQVPLDDPSDASYVGAFATGRSCHDWAVILGNVMRAACSGGDGFSMFSLGGPSGGSLDNPLLLYSRPVPGIGGHSGSFTWDGKLYIHGWEPGGGSGARCTATGTQVTPTTVQTDEMKSYFFFDTETGASLGKFVLPRDQTVLENCTIHNYNVVPTDKRYLLVAGNYQAGISVVDFTERDPVTGNVAAKEVAFADPAPLLDPDPPVGIELGGDWSTYWYNGFIYESDILRGLMIWKLSDSVAAGAKKLGHLNPQTQETSFALKR
jgi:LVIVD repeat